MTTDGSGRFSILVCIDGSEESYRGLHYAIKFGRDHSDTDITLLYVRPSHGGRRPVEPAMALVDVGRLPLHAWHLASDPATLAPLQRARDLLVASGFLGADWHSDEIAEKSQRIGTIGQRVRYTGSRTGQSITLIVREADLVLTGILNEARFYAYDLVIVAPASGECGGEACIDTYTAIGVASEHEGSVILVRDLQEGHGHFVCVSNTESSMKMVRKNAGMARRCGCAIHLYAVADSESRLDTAKRALVRAEGEIEAAGLAASGSLAEVGDPVWRIIERGRSHSLIVLSGTEKSALKKLIAGSVSHRVLQKARSSVMIVR